jgi:hypothetical protein
MSCDEPAGPIATAHGSLLDWLSAAGVPAHLAPPGGDASGEVSGGGDTGDGGPGSVRVWPVALLPELATRETGGPGPLRLRVRYLIAAGATSASAEVLDRLLLASLVDSSVQVAVEPISTGTWRAFGLSPRLGLYADIPVQVARPRPALPRVRSPLRLEGRPLGRVHGRVIGPGGVPVPGIRVVVEETGAATYTGNRGHFTFPAFPAGRPVRLRLSGRGLHLAAEVAGQSEEPIIIHCDTEGV